MRVKSNKSADRRRGTSKKTDPDKDLGNFKGCTLSRISAHFHAAGAGYSTATYDPISAFLPSRLFQWIPQVAKYWFHKKHAFRDYATHPNRAFLIRLEIGEMRDSVVKSFGRDQ
jgi:hypothetical protein